MSRDEHTGVSVNVMYTRACAPTQLCLGAFHGVAHSDTFGALYRSTVTLKKLHPCTAV